MYDTLITSIIFGGWYKVNKPRIKEYKNIINYSQIKAVANHVDSVYNNLVLFQK